MAVHSFKDLLVWQRASDFSIKIYEVFSHVKDYSFRDQIQRAALSIPNNIAEGYARRSDKSLRNYLLIAKGSAVETESMLLIASKLGYTQKETTDGLIDDIQSIQKMLSGFVRKL